MRLAEAPLRPRTAGQQVTAGPDGALGAVSDFDAETALAWRDGRLVYVDEALSVVIAEINRYRASKIRLADAALGQIRITIALPIDRTDALLSALEATEPVRIHRSAAGVTIRLDGRPD